MLCWSFTQQQLPKTAAERGKQYIDIYKPMLAISKNVKLSDNGFHLNENGYYYLASALEKELGLAPRPETITINIAKPTADPATPVKILEAGKQNGIVKFTINENYLPLPLPAQGEGIT